MLDRRTFIKTTLLATALPALTLARPTLASKVGLCLVVDGSCRDARQFVDHCEVTPLSVSDAAQVLTVLARDDVQRGFGLTRDSHFFLIEQMAGALGYRVGYHGVHDYRDGSLRHTLSGAHDLVDGLAQAFSVAAADWAVPLASAVPALNRDVTRTARIEVRGNSPRPVDSGGYLVSWCLHRA